MNTLKDIITGTAICLFIELVGFYMIKSSCESQEQYEIEHNCKFDYNDLCYTQEERPWLFDKNYTELN